MIFEGSANEVHAVGNERRGERVTGEASISAAIKREAPWLRAIDTATVRQAEIAAHRSISVAGRGSPTL